MRLASAIAIFFTTAFAQTVDPAAQFDAASVKPAGPPVAGDTGGMRGGPGTGDPGRITIPRATLSRILARAYDVLPEQISGPAWLDDSSTYAYRIDATLPPNTTREQSLLMLRNLLAERFHLRFHHETRTRPAYELVVATGGPKLKEWTPLTDAPAGKPTVDGNGFLRLPPGAPVGFIMGAGSIRMSYRQTMAMFCHSLGTEINISNGTPLGSPQPRVVDKTGLTGTYEFTLEFAGSIRSPGENLSAPADGEPGAPLASDPAEAAPDIFTALEKQLGLKLVKVKDAPVDMLIVDSADKVPTEN